MVDGECFIQSGQGTHCGALSSNMGDNSLYFAGTGKLRIGRYLFRRDCGQKRTAITARHGVCPAVVPYLLVQQENNSLQVEVLTTNRYYVTPSLFGSRCLKTLQVPRPSCQLEAQ